MRRALLFAVFALLAAQWVPVDRDNPPVLGEIESPPEVHAILERSCYDCHSNQTRWPWYSRMAPVSWLVASDVHEGHEHLNFSAWRSDSTDKRHELREEIRKNVEEGEMPLWFYLPLHPKARLDAADLQRLSRWTRDGR
ncbi:MAG: heme-binding domain-containing protein [Myxococcota bacterium]